MSREVDLSRFSGDLDAFAISDGGDLLWSTGIGADAALYFAASLGEPRFLLHAGRDATLAFANDGHDGVVADPQRKELLVIRDIRESGTRIDRWSSRDGIDQPVGVALDGAKHLLLQRTLSPYLRPADRGPQAVTLLLSLPVPPLSFFVYVAVLSYD